MKYLFTILFLLIVLTVFLCTTDINPIVPDTITYQVAADKLPFPDEIRTPGYPLFLKLTGTHTIIIQSFLWLATAFLIFKLAGYTGLIFYSFTIGLLFLSQKILSETLFIFVLTIALLSKKDMSFILICLLALIKPVMLFFIPIALLLKPKIQYLVIGICMIVFQSVLMKVYYDTWNVSKISEITYQKGINENHSYMENVFRNSIGKTAGIESLFWQRITQGECLFYTLIGLSGVFYFRKNPLYLIPAYIIICSGVAYGAGDRLHIAFVPVSLMILKEHYEQVRFRKIHRHNKTD